MWALSIDEFFLNLMAVTRSIVTRKNKTVATLHATSWHCTQFCHDLWQRIAKKCCKSLIVEWLRSRGRCMQRHYEKMINTCFYCIRIFIWFHTLRVGIPSLTLCVILLKMPRCKFRSRTQSVVTRKNYPKYISTVLPTNSVILFILFLIKLCE